MKTIYLCGAGGKGNAGAEAIMLAIIKLFQSRYPEVRFILTSWYPERVKQLLQRQEGNFVSVRRESLLNNPLEIMKADLFVICGDVSISETVVTFLPLYYGLKVMLARLLGTRSLLLGIEAEKIKRWYNLLAIRHLMGRTGVRHILRNQDSYHNLESLVPTSTLLLGCEPSLTLPASSFRGFEYHNPKISDSKLLVGFGLRDHFTEPFRVNPLTGRLVRRDAKPGELTERMRQIIDFTARIGDDLVERHDAQLLFIPHHYLLGQDQVIMTDTEVADQVLARMRHPQSVVRIEDGLHPFTLLTIYRRLHLVFSMRHHTNAFAAYHHVPTFGYRIAAKIASFFKDLRKEDMLIDPLTDSPESLRGRIDTAIADREAIAADLRERMVEMRGHMARALDMALLVASS